MGNTFSSKYEAICAVGTDRARRIGAELLARPAREPLWDALVNAVLVHYEGADAAPGREWLAGLRLVLTAPAIRGEYLKVNSEMQRALAAAIATRTGTDPEQDLYPDVLAGAVIAATQVAVRRWAAADPPCRSGRCCGRSSISWPRSAPALGGRYLTEEEFKALVRPPIFGPNGPLCEPREPLASYPKRRWHLVCLAPRRVALRRELWRFRKVPRPAGARRLVPASCVPLPPHRHQAGTNGGTLLPILSGRGGQPLVADTVAAGPDSLGAARARHLGADALHDLVRLVLGDLDELIVKVAALCGD